MSRERLQIAEAFLSMTMRPCDAWAHEDSAMRDHLLYQILQYPCFALPSLENMTCILGFVHNFGHCTSWMVTGEGFEKTARMVLRQQRGILSDMYRALPVRVMDAEVLACRPDAMRWAEAVGFEFETFLQRRGPGGEDVAVFLWPERKENQCL